MLVRNVEKQILKALTPQEQQQRTNIACNCILDPRKLADRVQQRCSVEISGYMNQKLLHLARLLDPWLPPLMCYGETVTNIFMTCTMTVGLTMEITQYTTGHNIGQDQEK